MISYRVTSILVHIILVSVFLSIFFFTYATKIESNIVQSQSRQIVKEIVGDVTILLPKNVSEDVASVVETIQTPDMAEDDKKATQTNNELKRKVALFIGVWFLVGITIGLFISHAYGFSFSEIVRHSLIILFFVALTEYVFLDYFVRNYISIDTNYVKYIVLKTLNDDIQKSSI